MPRIFGGNFAIFSSGKCHVQSVLGRHDGKHEASEEEHHDRIGESGHYALVRHESAGIRIAEEGYSLVGNSQQRHYYYEKRGRPVRDYLKHPHHRRKDEERDHPLLGGGESVDTEERRRYRPQEDGYDQHNRQQDEKLDVEFVFCQSLAIYELGKSGYEIDFSEGQNNNVQTASEFMRTALDGSGWKFLRGNANLLEEDLEQAFQISLVNDIQGKKVEYILENGKYTKKETNTTFSKDGLIFFPYSEISRTSGY